MNTKTPIMALQEYMQKKRRKPVYMFMGSDGNTFRYKVEVENVSAIGSGQTKKNAQHHAAKLILEKLNNSSNNIPHIHSENYQSDGEGKENIFENSISELQQICAKRSLELPVYREISEYGPPHMRVFGIECSLLDMKFTAEGPTKKAAKQLAARKLLHFYLKNIPRHNSQTIIESGNHFNKLNHAALKKFDELKANWDEPVKHKSKSISCYQYGLKTQLGREKWEKVMKLFTKHNIDTCDPIETIEIALGIMEMDYNWSVVLSRPTTKIASLRIWRAVPPICILSGGCTPEAAKINTAEEAIKYISCLLSF